MTDAPCEGRDAEWAKHASRLTSRMSIERLPKAGSRSNRRRRIDAGPEIHRAQLLAAAGLEVQKQLRTVGRAPTEHQVDDEGATRGLVAVKSVDLGTEVRIGHIGHIDANQTERLVTAIKTVLGEMEVLP